MEQYSISYIYLEMKYGQLISLTCSAITSLNQNIMTPDSHSELFLEQHRHLEDTEQVFIKQVFYGCYRYRDFLKAFNRVLFSLYPSRLSSNDETTFMIFTYLVCFRLNQLPPHEFKKMVLSQNAVKINVLFDLLLDCQKLRELVKPQWSKCLDEEYVEDKIIAPLEEAIPSLVELASLVCQKATGKKSDLVATHENTIGVDALLSQKNQKKPSTVFQPFNLTRPKVKELPEPEMIQNIYRANPVPESKKTLKEIEDDKVKRRQQIKQNINKFYEENQKQPELQSSKRPSNLVKLKEMQETKLREMTTKVKYSRPVPDFGEVETKLNVAAILREEKKLKERIEEEQRKIRELEVNMRDETQFEGWKARMKDKDKLEEMEQQHRKKIEMELSRQAAIKAFQDKIEQNKASAEDMKEIYKELKAQREDLQRTEFENKKRIVNEIGQQKDNIVVQREKVVEKNKKVHDEEKDKRKRVLDKKKEQEDTELLKKKQLINEIRDLMKQPKNKAKIVDASTTMGYGLLEEMSLQDLRGRLREVQLQRKKEEEEKRKEILDIKMSQQKELNSKKDKIMEYRVQQSKQKAEERQNKRKETETQKQRAEEIRIKSLNEFKLKEQERLQKKKDQQDQLNKELKQISQKRQFLNENQAAVQSNAFKNMEMGAQRQTLQRQNQKLLSKQRQERVHRKEKTLIADSNKRQIQSKIDFNKSYNKARDQANRVHEQLQKDERMEKAMMFQEVKVFEQKHLSNMASMSEYKAKINEMSLTKAKQQR